MIAARSSHLLQRELGSIITKESMVEIYTHLDVIVFVRESSIHHIWTGENVGHSGLFQFKWNQLMQLGFHPIVVGCPNILYALHTIQLIALLFYLTIQVNHDAWRMLSARERPQYIREKVHSCFEPNKL